MDVMISIRSSQNLDGNDDTGPELITEGTYEFAEDGICFSYMESELTGLGGTKTTFLVNPTEVTLSRRGSVNMRMLFRTGEPHHFRYHTPAGSLDMGIRTHRLFSTLNEHGGGLEIEYDLQVDRSFLSRNRFIINVREKERES